MPQPIYLVDAFAHAPFTGNPAGVCPLEAPADEAWMQRVAAEMNQAETAFFWPEGDRLRLRWFTPALEVDLCGHATLASAHVLFKELQSAGIGHPLPDLPQGGGAGDIVRFITKSGELACRAVDGGIEMDFPSEAPEEADPFPVSAALGAEPVWYGANRMDWFFVLESAEQLLSLKPDMGAIERLGKRGVIVTAQTNLVPEDSLPLGGGLGWGSAHSSPPDFVSRFFAPQSGIAEDPVTGSAHCALGPYWAARLGKESVVGYQASLRGGYVGVEVRGARVALSGPARTVLVGELT